MQTGAEIVKRETPLGLYKGLGAVMTGIIPKMAIRFTSYESYKGMLSNQEGKISGTGTFFGRLSQAVAVGSHTDIKFTQLALLQESLKLLRSSHRWKSLRSGCKPNTIRWRTRSTCQSIEMPLMQHIRSSERRASEHYIVA